MRGRPRVDADRILERMRTRPNFEGYLRDSMYWTQLSALLLVRYPRLTGLPQRC
jgi:hypothetical protein